MNNPMPITDDPSVSARNWISGLLQVVANRLSVKILTWHWQACDTTYDTSDFELVVVGSRGRRVIKLFTADELTRCMKDKELQTEILVRLTQLVNFLGTRRHTQSSKNQGRKHH